MQNSEVTALLKQRNHPMSIGIEHLRSMALALNLEENIKWNGPNYLSNGNDRITFRVQSPKLVQVILHLGAKTEKMPDKPLIEKTHPFIELKGKDRVILTFKTNEDILENSEIIGSIMEKWILLAS